jgi:hypothetical protein
MEGCYTVPIIQQRYYCTLLYHIPHPIENERESQEEMAHEKPMCTQR